uniref:Uncharacterized protein n=1 Tax=Anguilla anguilla TaxID=7936 RepID=A0A0E9S6V6_ANGAN
MLGHFNVRTSKFTQAYLLWPTRAYNFHLVFASFI